MKILNLFAHGLKFKVYIVHVRKLSVVHSIFFFIFKKNTQRPD